MRLNSQRGTEGLPASLNCDRPLHSGIRAPKTVMSTGGQITDSVRPYAPRRSLQHQNLLSLPGRQAGYGPLSAVRRRTQRPALEETGRQTTYCKHTAPGSPNRPTCAVTIVTAAAHHPYIHIPCIIKGACAMGRFDLASALTIDCLTSLCFCGQPDSSEDRVHNLTLLRLSLTILSPSHSFSPSTVLL